MRISKILKRLSTIVVVFGTVSILWLPAWANPINQWCIENQPPGMIDLNIIVFLPIASVYLACCVCNAGFFSIWADDKMTEKLK